MMVMQYKGNNMSQYLKSNYNIISLRIKLCIFYDIARGLKEIHRGINCDTEVIQKVFHMLIFQRNKYLLIECMFCLLKLLVQQRVKLHEFLSLAHQQAYIILNL